MHSPGHGQNHHDEIQSSQFQLQGSWEWKWLLWSQSSNNCLFKPFIVRGTAASVRHLIVPATGRGTGGASGVQCQITTARKIWRAWGVAEAVWTWEGFSQRNCHMVGQKLQGGNSVSSILTSKTYHYHLYIASTLTQLTRNLASLFFFLFLFCLSCTLLQLSLPIWSKFFFIC